MNRGESKQKTEWETVIEYPSPIPQIYGLVTDDLGSCILHHCDADLDSDSSIWAPNVQFAANQAHNSDNQTMSWEILHTSIKIFLDVIFFMYQEQANYWRIFSERVAWSAILLLHNGKNCSGICGLDLDFQWMQNKLMLDAIKQTQCSMVNTGCLWATLIQLNK